MVSCAVSLMRFRLEEVVGSFDQSEGVRDLVFSISESRRSERISRRRGARWRSRSRRVEETEAVEKESSFSGGRGGKGGASGNSALPLSTSGVDRKWCGARLAHTSVYYDISCESSWLKQSIGMYIYTVRRSL